MGDIIQVKVLKPGLLTTIQDYGRRGHLAFGVPQSGVMSKVDADRANWLVGNEKGSPVLEITLVGPTLELSGQGQIALAGAPIKAQLDDSEMPLLTTVKVSGKQLLRLGPVESGCRSYLAVAGEWQITTWLGSCSASPVESHILTPESTLKADLQLTIRSGKEVRARKLKPITYDDAPVRVMPGPEYNQVPIASIRDFLNRSFQISPQSSRMGYRLLGKLSEYYNPREVISSGIIPGTIQVTNNGELILLMADAQSSGGYTRLANVISRDMSKVAQLRPGDNIKFKLISLSESLLIK